jgi:hypothetical protein
MPLFVPALPESETYGVLAEFHSPHALLHACEKVRDSGFQRWDAYSPFPVHGLNQAMGLRRSPLPYIVLFFGLLGATTGITLQLWANGIAYPISISGKPMLNWQPYMPITFELGVLFAAISALVGMLGLNQLPMHYHPLFGSDRFQRATDDGFFVAIESWDPKFDVVQTPKFLQGLGATHVEVVKRGVSEDRGASRTMREAT